MAEREQMGRAVLAEIINQHWWHDISDDGLLDAILNRKDSEGNKLLGITEEWKSEPDSEGWWWFSVKLGDGFVLDGCYELSDSRDGFFCNLGYVSGWWGKWSKAIVPD